jgi:hypothetical protein
MAKKLQRRLKGYIDSAEKALVGKKKSPMSIVSDKPVTAVVAALLLLIAVAQLLRAVFQVKVVANGVVIPLWPSIVACIVFAALAYLLWREHT